MRKYLTALAVLLGLSSLAYALTVPPTVAVRQLPWQAVNTLRFTVNWNDGNIANGVKIGALPSRAFVTAMACHVETAFNAGGVDYLGVGTTQASTANGTGDWINGVPGSTATCDLTSATYQALTTANGLGLRATSPTTVTGTSGGWDVWVRYYQQSTAASAGKVTVVMQYVPDNDM